MKGNGAEDSSPKPPPPPPPEWKFSQVFGERAAGEEVQEGTIFPYPLSDRFLTMRGQLRVSSGLHVLFGVAILRFLCFADRMAYEKYWKCLVLRQPQGMLFYWGLSIILWERLEPVTFPNIKKYVSSFFFFAWIFYFLWLFNEFLVSHFCCCLWTCNYSIYKGEIVDYHYVSLLKTFIEF